MTVRTQKFKVSVSALIDEISKRRQEEVSKHEATMAEYPGKVVKWKADTLAVLEKATSRAEHDKPLETDYNGRLTVPSYPVKPVLNVAGYDRTIKTLQMCTDETIAITTDDYASYVR